MHQLMISTIACMSFEEFLRPSPFLPSPPYRYPYPRLFFFCSHSPSFPSSSSEPDPCLLLSMPPPLLLVRAPMPTSCPDPRPHPNLFHQSVHKEHLRSTTVASGRVVTRHGGHTRAEDIRPQEREVDEHHGQDLQTAHSLTGVAQGDDESDMSWSWPLFPLPD